ncbi:MAG: membrane protein insertion efficiency factor YidD [bacterium]|nr:membrane protein insertion efficiency factor YidD [bacterium]
MPRRILIFGIRLYQKTLSPDHGVLRALFLGGFCRYHPSCSEYARRSIEKRGVFFGSMWAIWRVIRCNPFSKGGVDEA